MSWPNSIAITRPLPGGPSTFPGLPANDNWRMPRTNLPVPRPPANDNFPRRSRGLKLPGVLRRIPAVQIGYAVIWLFQTIQGQPARLELNGWDIEYCPPPNNGMTPTSINSAGTSNCTGLYQSDLRNSAIPSPTAWSALVHHQDFNQLHPAFGWPATWRIARLSRNNASDPFPEILPETVPSRKLVPIRQPIPALLPAPSVLPGRYIAPKQIMPEWPSAGYDHPNQPRPVQERYLKSEPPPRGTRERKVRARDYAIGRTIEWLVGQATEGLDFLRALFEALPWWRKIALYKAARRLELQYDQGRIVRGRLHYVDLTPDAKMQAIYDYIDEIDVAQAIENVIKQQLTDMLWAEIGQRMGRYQVGPWDDHGYMGPEEEPDWEYYVPDTAPDTAHNHWTYETLVNRRLTRQEAERIHRRYDQYRSQLYEG